MVTRCFQLCGRSYSMIVEDVRIEENVYKANLSFFVYSQMCDLFSSLLVEEGTIDNHFCNTNFDSSISLMLQVFFIYVY